MNVVLAREEIILLQKIKRMISSTGINEVQGKNGNTINMSQVIAEREKKVIAKLRDN